MIANHFLLLLFFYLWGGWSADLREGGIPTYRPFVCNKLRVLTKSWWWCSCIWTINSCGCCYICHYYHPVGSVMHQALRPRQWTTTPTNHKTNGAFHPAIHSSCDISLRWLFVDDYKRYHVLQRAIIPGKALRRHSTTTSIIVIIIMVLRKFTIFCFFNLASFFFFLLWCEIALHQQQLPSSVWAGKLQLYNK